MATAPALDRKRPSAHASGARRERAQALPSVAWVPVILVVVGLVALHVSCLSRYGYFRDELYYIACAKRLDWGFVDQPPLSVALLKWVAGPLGYPLWLVRVPAVAAGALTTLVAALIARELGGKSLAQVLAATMVAVSPTYLVVNHLYSMNSLDVLFWALAAWTFVGLTRPGRRWMWLVLGLLCGLAVLNKLSGLWLIAGVAVATLFTERRKDLAHPEPWVAVGLTAAALIPYGVWQLQHDWVTLEFVRNSIQSKLIPIAAWMFLVRELAVMNPFSWPVWVVGLVVALINPKWRPLALVWLTVVAILLVNGKARENYLSPAYAFLFAPGAVQFEAWAGRNSAWLKGYMGLLWASGLAVSGIVTPILPPEMAAEGIRRLKALAPTEVPNSEVGPKNDLMGLADMYGWPEMAAAVDRVWVRLTPEERRRAVVFTHNYGQASAIDFFSRAPGLKVVGRHNNWWLWGPGAWDGEVAVLVGEVPPTVRESFESVELVSRLNSRYAMPEEARAPIWLARGLRKPVSAFWSASRRLD